MAYYTILVISICMILSYMFNVYSPKLKVPSVILLIATGIGLQYLTAQFGFSISISTNVLKIIGTIGLIMIVLEGSLDLKLSSDKLTQIRKSFKMAIFVLAATSVLISIILYLFSSTTYIHALIHAVPLSIISSAIVIPTAFQLDDRHKDFLVLESTFSDILGILFFNFLIYQSEFSLRTLSVFSINTILTIVISIMVSLALFWMFHTSRYHEALNVFILSILMSVYALGKILHLSSLIMVLIMGLVFNNYDEIVNFLKEKFKSFEKIPSLPLSKDIREFKHICSELTFAIRTFFFVALGYSLDIAKILNFKIIITAIIVVVAIYLVRYLSLKYLLKDDVYPNIYFAPRGLITILLYLSIPEKFQIVNFDDGVLFLVMIITSCVMILGLISKNKAISGNKAE